MEQSVAIGLSVVVIYALVILIGKKFRLSSRYERKPRTLNNWSALDKGIDPTDSEKA
jgi:hypothetical protein